MFGEGALGIYASVAAPVLIIQMGAQYLYAPMLTRFAELFQSGDTSAFWKMFNRLTLAIAGIAIVGIVLFSVFGQSILTFLYSDSIAAYTDMLVSLIVCTSATAYVWFIGDLLIAVRDLRGNLILFSISMAVCCVCMFPFVSAFMMNGVIYCVAASFLAGLLFSFARLRRDVAKVKPNDSERH